MTFKAKNREQETIIIPDNGSSDIDIYSYPNENEYFSIFPEYYAPIYRKNSETDIRNKKLEEKYGIKSDIKSPQLLANIEKAVEEFCKINNDNNLFKNGTRQLRLSEKPLEKKTLFFRYKINDNDEFEITYNSNYEFNKLQKNIKIMYDKGDIGSDSSNYRFYQTLGNFLNFSHNENAYIENEQEKFSFDNLTENARMFRKKLSRDNNGNAWNSSYIAAKMSGQYLPLGCDFVFKNYGGNTNLEFPKTKYPQVKNRSEIEFSAVNEAEKYLAQKFKINAKFTNLNYANACVNAVEELTNAIGDKNVFNGLEIITTKEKFNPNETALAFSDYCPDTDFREPKLFINEYRNYTNSNFSRYFDNGYCSSANLKTGLFIHELAHILDNKFDNEHKYASLVKSGLDFNDFGQNLAAKVSVQATKNVDEFLAEYVAGRMDGHKYPEGVNSLFSVLWGGPKINFPS